MASTSQGLVKVGWFMRHTPKRRSACHGLAASSLLAGAISWHPANLSRLMARLRRHAIVACEEMFRCASFLVKAGDTVSDFRGGLAGLEVLDFSLDGEERFDMWQRKVFNETGRGPDGSDFEPSTAFPDGLELDWSFLKPQVGDGVHDRRLVLLDREEEVSLLLFHEEQPLSDHLVHCLHIDLLQNPANGGLARGLKGIAGRVAAAASPNSL